jgi:hydrogenase maturation protein HypF
MKTYRIKIQGIVQGVGFRPFIFKLAEKYHLNGYVTNSPSGVEIEINCSGSKVLNAFVRDIELQCPPLAHIVSIEKEKTDYRDFDHFTIEPSKTGGGITLVPTDTAVCHDCLHEISDPSDRRYQYAFTNCTNCGPRYSIIKNMPYDRPKTTMSKFRMCPECQAEYDNPADRRFHAQPNACPVCGPMVYMGKFAGVEAIEQAAILIDSGKIVAVKGLGGYHLVCDATNDTAVKTLRNLKHRPDKPLAVMCTEASLMSFCSDEAEIKLFASVQSPIVIINAPKAPVSRFVNPMSDNIGFMSPYTPLHRILLSKCKTSYLVATSGNKKDEPIAADERSAEKTLSGITEHFLHHTRPVHNRVDDSLCAVVGGMPYVMRRARGFAPYPIMLPSSVDGCVLAVGAHLKNTVAIAEGRYAFVSQYIGDLDNPETCSFFEETVDKMQKLYGLKPESVMCDLHPEYFSSRYAKSSGLPVQKVQHHISHMMACMAENGLRDNVLGVIMDGTGLGTDGTIWGGEFLLMKDRKVSRVASLPKVMQPGLDNAAKNPGRMLISYLHYFGLLEEFRSELVSKLYIPDKDIRLTVSMMDRNINCIPTTSAGRMLESLGAAVTGITTNLFEAHSAMKMEGFAKSDCGQTIQSGTFSDDSFRDLFRTAMEGLLSSSPKVDTAGLILNSFLNIIKQEIFLLCNKYQVEDIVLSGGVFQNLFLINRMHSLDGLNFYRHKNVPPNDSCISLGQLYYRTYSKIRNIVT